jgi:hypothetical protein
MRRSLPAAATVLAGLIVLLDLLVVNPSLGGAAAALQELLILLAAAAAVGGSATLATRHVRELADASGDRIGSIVLLAGMGTVLVAGLRPGSVGASDPVVLWLVAALLVPLITALFAMLFVFLLSAARSGLATQGRETAVMLAAAAIAVALLLPIGGAAGDWLAAASDWVRSVPLAGVFRGLLIGVAILGAVTGTRILLGVDRGNQ